MKSTILKITNNGNFGSKSNFEIPDSRRGIPWMLNRIFLRRETNGADPPIRIGVRKVGASPRRVTTRDYFLHREWAKVRVGGE